MEYNHEPEQNTMTTVLSNYEATKQLEREFAAANPLQVGNKITLHFQGFYHASCQVVKVTEKAIQVTGSPDSSNRVYTVWFPKSAIELFAYQCPGEIAYSGDIKRWFIGKMERNHEKLLGTLA